MESAAREMNLTDVAQRLEKIIVEARHIGGRIEEAVDVLRGSRPTDEGKTSICPEPSGLVPLLSTRLAALEVIQHEQRQSLNRLSEGLCELPSAIPLGGLNNAAPLQMAQLQNQLSNKYASR